MWKGYILPLWNVFIKSTFNICECVHKHAHTYIYICVCVCVCVCMNMLASERALLFTCNSTDFMLI